MPYPETITRFRLMQDGSFSFLNRTQLMKLRFKAMRSGVWFKALPRIDRVLIDLTIRVADIIHSTLLANSILAVVGKLQGHLESRISKSIRSIGQPLAETISLIAQRWGNASAKKWATDSSFALYLTVINVNR